MYDALLIDTLNLAYRVFDKKRESPVIKVASRTVSFSYLKDFLDEIRFLREKFLKSGGEVYLLFDNPTSREEIRNLFKPLPAHMTRKAVNRTYKADRARESAVFYATVDVLRYYYTISDRSYRTVQIANLEADDLVAPCLQYLGDKSSLLVTNDSDWCRYISPTVHFLPNIHAEPKTADQLTIEKGFVLTPEKIILEKIIEGDRADNIQSVFPEFPPLIRSLAVREFSSIQDLIERGPEIDFMSEWKQLLKDRVLEARAAYQMLATIPVSVDQFKYNCVIGRSVTKLVEGINKLVYGKTKTPSFEFGGLKTPRIQPKG